MVIDAPLASVTFYWFYSISLRNSRPQSLVLLANKHNHTCYTQASGVTVVIFCIINKSTVSLQLFL